MPETVKNLLKLFADDSKLIAQIKNRIDIQNVQNDIDSLVAWAKEWRMAFNYEKCKSMEISKHKFTSIPIQFSMSIGTDRVHNISQTKSEKDLGVILSDDLKWNNHVSQAVSKAYAILAILKRTFIYWNVTTFKTLYTAYVRPQLEYAVPVWNPNRRREINMIEKVQRRATKLVPKLKNLKYETRLRMIGLTTLEKRRERGDLIQFYKVSNGINKINWFHPIKSALSISATGPASSVRGQNQRIERQITSNCDKRHNFFVNRIVPIWNNLPSQTVKAKTTNHFKNLLDTKETLN